jgi:WD40 repeat protein
MITNILVLPPPQEAIPQGESEERGRRRLERSAADIKKNLKFITSSRDGTAKVWNASTLKCEETINVGKSWVTSI